MTVRTTTLRGLDAGTYYVEEELEYYLDRGEPPGQWAGHGAERLGLAREVDDGDFLALMGGLDPKTGEQLGSAHTERTARGYDVTCSAPKSVSVLWALGDDAMQREVVAAHDAAVGAVVDWIERHAHTRFRVDGQVRVFDAEGIVAAVFRQHTSRALDPQLHTHAVIVNRVPAPDGRWLALDARTIKQDQQTLSRLYHAGLRAELTRRLGVRWREPVNGIAEIADVPEPLLREFSQRSDAIAARIEQKLEQFEERHERPPTPRERWRLERDAVVKSRSGKSDTEPEVLREVWRERSREVGIAPGWVPSATTDRVERRRVIDEPCAQQIVETALGALVESQSTWRMAEVVRALAAAVPTDAAIPASVLASWLDELADHVARTRMVELAGPVPEDTARRRDGRPITEAAADRRLTTPGILAQEERLVALAGGRVAESGHDREIENLDGLAPAQHALATAVAGERDLVLAVGPAGTGKTTALWPGVEQLRCEGRVVFGVAPSASAAEVLAVDSGVQADTLDKLLVEHRLDRPPDHRYDLPAGATVIVDEAAMVSTPKLAELFELAEQRAWRLVLVGDPMQFSAVGRSGMFGHLVDTFGAIELGRVHRFTDDWEARASLRLRDGDVTVVAEYDDRGRLHGGTPRQMHVAAVRAWWDAREQGRSVCLVAGTNAAVVELNEQAQVRRLVAGELDRAGTTLEVGPYLLHEGDEIATRHNARTLLTDRNAMVKNRDQWTVDTIHPDGSLSVSGRTGAVRLPAEYVAAHVELAYAQTSHASQGRTVDHSILCLDAPTSAAGIYVPMTRGRDINEAFVVVQGEQTPADVVTEALSRHWIDRPAVAVRAEMSAGTDAGGSAARAHHVPLSGAELRALFERSVELTRAVERSRYRLDDAKRSVAQIAQSRTRAESQMADLENRLAGARATLEQHDRPLVRRLHREEVEGARSMVRWMPGAIDDHRANLKDLDAEQRAAKKELTAAKTEAKRVPQFKADLAEVRREVDADVRLRAEHPMYLSTDARDVLGPRPHDPEPARLWDDAAGRLSQHQEAWNVTDGLGHRPRILGEEAYSLSHHAASESVDRLDRSLGRAIEPPSPSLGLSL